MVLVQWNHLIWAEIGTRTKEQLNPEALGTVNRYTACISSKVCCKAFQLREDALWSCGVQKLQMRQLVQTFEADRTQLTTSTLLYFTRYSGRSLHIDRLFVEHQSCKLARM